MNEVRKVMKRLVVGVLAHVEAGIYDAIKMDMAEEDYLNPRSRY